MDQQIVCDDDIRSKQRLRLLRDIRKQRTIIREFESATSLSPLPSQKRQQQIHSSLNRNNVGSALNFNDSESEQDAEIRWYQYNAVLLACLQRQLYNTRLEGGRFVVYQCQRSRASFGLRKLQVDRSMDQPAEMLSVSRYGVMRWYKHEDAIRIASRSHIADGNNDYNDNEDDNQSSLASHSGEEEGDYSGAATRVQFIDQLKSVRAMKLPQQQHNDSSDGSEEENCGGEGLNSGPNWLASNLMASESVLEYSRLRPPQPKNARVVHLQWKNGRQTWLIALEGKELVETIGTHLKHYNAKKANTVSHLKAMLRMQLTPVDCHEAVNPDSVCGQLLSRLWSAYFSQTPEALAVQMTSNDYLTSHEYWKLMGFQSCKPCTDFRGTGLLGLLCLVHLTEKAAVPLQRQRSNSSLSVASTVLLSSVTVHSRTIDGSVWWMHDLIMRTRSSLPKLTERDCTTSDPAYPQLTSGCRAYPWAVAGINMVSVITSKLLGLQSPAQYLYRLASDPGWDSALLNFLSYLECADNNYSINSVGNDDFSGDSDEDRINKGFPAFEEFFCFCMGLLDRAYSESGASYMDFQRILQVIVEKVNDWIDCGERTQKTKQLLSRSFPSKSFANNSAINQLSHSPLKRPLTIADLLSVSKKLNFASAI